MSSQSPTLVHVQPQGCVTKDGGTVGAAGKCSEKLEFETYSNNERSPAKTNDETMSVENSEQAYFTPRSSEVSQMEVIQSDITIPIKYHQNISLENQEYAAFKKFSKQKFNVQATEIQDDVESESEVINSSQRIVMDSEGSAIEDTPPPSPNREEESQLLCRLKPSFPETIAKTNTTDVVLLGKRPRPLPSSLHASPEKPVRETPSFPNFGLGLNWDSESFKNIDSVDVHEKSCEEPAHVVDSCETNSSLDGGKNTKENMSIEKVELNSNALDNNDVEECMEMEPNVYGNANIYSAESREGETPQRKVLFPSFLNMVPQLFCSSFLMLIIIFRPLRILNKSTRIKKVKHLMEVE